MVVESSSSTMENRKISLFYFLWIICGHTLILLLLHFYPSHFPYKNPLSPLFSSTTKASFSRILLHKEKRNLSIYFFIFCSADACFIFFFFYKRKLNTLSLSHTPFDNHVDTLPHNAIIVYQYNMVSSYSQDFPINKY